MAVSESERDYFRRIGEAKQASHHRAAAAHQALTLEERLRRSVELSRAYRTSAAPRIDDPGPFYDRARALGLYKG